MRSRVGCSFGRGSGARRVRVFNFSTTTGFVRAWLKLGRTCTFFASSSHRFISSSATGAPLLPSQPLDVKPCQPEDRRQRGRPSPRIPIPCQPGPLTGSDDRDHNGKNQIKHSHWGQTSAHLPTMPDHGRHSRKIAISLPTSTRGEPTSSRIVPCGETSPASQLL